MIKTRSFGVSSWLFGVVLESPPAARIVFEVAPRPLSLSLPPGGPLLALFLLFLQGDTIRLTSNSKEWLQQPVCFAITFNLSPITARYDNMVATGPLFGCSQKCCRLQHYAFMPDRQLFLYVTDCNINPRCYRGLLAPVEPDWRSFSQHRLTKTACACVHVYVRLKEEGGRDGGDGKGVWCVQNIPVSDEVPGMAESEDLSRLSGQSFLTARSAMALSDAGDNSVVSFLSTSQQKDRMILTLTLLWPFPITTTLRVTLNTETG